MGTAKKPRVSVLSLLLTVSLVGVAVGWLAERNHYKKRQEQAELVLDRWAQQIKAVRLASSWKALRESGGDLATFDYTIDGELYWVLQEAFTLRSELKSMGFGGEVTSIAREAADLLGYKSPEDVRHGLTAFLTQGYTVEEYVDDGGDEAYPFLFIQDSAAYSEFTSFLDEVFEK